MGLQEHLILDFICKRVSDLSFQKYFSIKLSGFEIHNDYSGEIQICLTKKSFKMKKFMLIVAIVGFAFAANAQTTKQKSKKEKSKTEVSTKKYTCSKCGTSYAKDGKCCGAPLTMTEKKETKMEMKDHVCTSACKPGKCVYAHGEKGHVCGEACKKR